MGCGSGCKCGCNSNISYGYNKSCSKTYAGINFCKDPFAYVKESFVVPAAGVVLEIKVTDSSRLYLGEGIGIGGNYFQVAAIEDTNNISIVHDGSAEEGLNITALNPAYGCYNYPILFVGPIDQLITPEVEGLDSDFDPVADSVTDITLAELRYSYVSPTKVFIDFTFDCTIANTPFAIGVDVPVTANGNAATMAAKLYNATPGNVPALAYKRTQTIVIAMADGVSNLSNGVTSFRFSGRYDVDV